MRKLSRTLILILFISLSRSQTRTNSSPAWNYDSCTEKASYLTNANDHVTKISSEEESSKIVSLRVNDEDRVPNDYHKTDDDIELNLNQRITQIVAYAVISGSDVDVKSIDFTFTNPGTTQTRF